MSLAKRSYIREDKLSLRVDLFRFLHSLEIILIVLSNGIKTYVFNSTLVIFYAHDGLPEIFNYHKINLLIKEIE